MALKRPEDFVSSYEETSFGSAIAHSIQAKPFVSAGMLGLVGSCVYAGYRYKTKGFAFSPSLFLIQLRVGAQALVVGCLTCGMLYNFYQTNIKKEDSDSKST